MGLALDEPKDNDETVEGEGFNVVADKALLEQMGGISVDFRESMFGAGFVIRPSGEHAGGSCAC